MKHPKLHKVSCLKVWSSPRGIKLWEPPNPMFWGSGLHVEKRPTHHRRSKRDFGWSTHEAKRKASLAKLRISWQWTDRYKCQGPISRGKNTGKDLAVNATDTTKLSTKGWDNYRDTPEYVSKWSRIVIILRSNRIYINHPHELSTAVELVQAQPFVQY